MEKRGIFIVFEGIDGSGTSTQLIRLIEAIEKKNKYQDVLRTHEPWKSEEIKRQLANDKEAYSDAYEMACLFLNDRIRHNVELIKPNLERGVVVLCDRYSMSTCAYQSTQGANLLDLIRMHFNRDILIPDLTFFIDVPTEIAQYRLKNRAFKEKFEEEEFQRDLVPIYRGLVKYAKDGDTVFGRVKVIDGSKSIEDVGNAISKSFDEVYSSLR